MKKRYISEIIIGFMIIISMTISINFILRVENKIDKFEYIINNSNLGSNIAIMVYDNGVQDYLKVKDIPIGLYKLNEEKTGCIGKGIISNYNSLTGKIKFETEAADECYLYFDKYQPLLSEYIKTLHNVQDANVGNGKLYLHDSTIDNGAGDDSYRYSGADPNNYICFEGDVCDDEHKYRIIGVFENNAKLIKMESIGNLPRDAAGSNQWIGSSLESFLNNEWVIDMKHSSLIEEYTWGIGEYTSYLIPQPKTMLAAELQLKSSVKRKIGLVYAGDYGYGADKTHWDTILYSYEQARENNWLYINANEWTISRVKGYSGAVYIVSHGSANGIDGMVGYNANVTLEYAVRPTFYLKSTIKIIEGEGTNTNPWIIGA